MKRDQSLRMSLAPCILFFVFAGALASNSTDPDENWSRKMPKISSKQDVNPRYSQHPEKSEGLRSKLIYSPEQTQEHQQTVGATLSFKHPQFTGIEKVIRNTHKSTKAFEEKQSYDQPMIQQSESGVVYQVHPQALKSGQVYQTPQSFKQVQADGTTLNFVPHQQYPSLPQPQYLVQQAQNTLLSKQPAVFYAQPLQSATPLPYHSSLTKLPQLSQLNQYTPTPQVLNYQPTSQTVLPPQFGQYLSGAKLPAPQKLVGAYPLTQQSFIDKGKVVSGLANYKAAPNVVALPNGVIGQSPQQGSGLVFGQTQQNQAVNFLGDDTQGGGPDFSKMFQSYFNSGPFAQSFQNDGEKPSGTSLIPNVNSEFNNFFGELNQASPTNVVKKEPAEDQFKPCNFFQASNAKIQDDDADDYRRPSKPTQRPYRGPYRESSEEDDDDDDSDDDSSEDNSSEQKYKYPQRHEESLNRYRNNDDNVDYNPYRKPKSSKDEGSSQSRDRYAGKSTNQRKVNSNRPRSSHEDDDDDDDEPAKKFRTEREKEQFENNYKEARARYVDSSNEEEANERPQKEATNPNTKTFYQYKYPPPPSYNAEGRTKPQSQAASRPEHRGAPKNEQRPPPVHEPDTVGYYSNISPKVTRDYVYTSQKVVMSANHPDLKNEMLKGA